jgi:hypothetical protein
MTERLRSAGSEPHELDALLHDFFRSELPAPWPAPPLPAPRAVRRPVLPWYRTPSRLALAASLLLALAGFWTLDRVFPTDTAAPPGPSLNTGANNIAKGPRDHPVQVLPLRPGGQVERRRTPGGLEAELREFNLPDGRMIIEVIELPGTPAAR